MKETVNFVSCCDRAINVCLYTSENGPVAHSVASLIADPGVLSSIPSQPYTFVEVDFEIFSYCHNLPSAE